MCKPAQPNRFASQPTHNSVIIEQVREARYTTSSAGVVLYWKERRAELCRSMHATACALTEGGLDRAELLYAYGKLRIHKCRVVA